MQSETQVEQIIYSMRVKAAQLAGTNQQSNCLDLNTNQRRSKLFKPFWPQTS